MSKKTIFSLRIASELVEKGNNLLYKTKNIDKPQFDVFVFEKTEKLEQDMKDIFKERDNK